MKALIASIFLLYSVVLSAQKRITLLFVGDLMQHQAQIDAARTPDGKYDYSSCFALVKEQISHADIAIGNLEVTLGGKPYRGYPTFSAPDEYLQAIKDAGFDVLLTANNHCLDRGKKGLERTIAQIDSLAIPYAGTYRNVAERTQRYPLFIRKKGFCIAILNYTYGTNGIKATPPNIVNYINKETILKDIHSAQAVRPDAIIACMHWGEEYQSLPNREQRELADWLLEQGVTHIIGSHPHVIQPMELREDGNRQHAVVYSFRKLHFQYERGKYRRRTHFHPATGEIPSALSYSSATRQIKLFTLARLFYPFFSILPSHTMRIHLSMDCPSHSYRRKKLHFISVLLSH